MEDVFGSTIIALVGFAVNSQARIGVKGRNVHGNLKSNALREQACL